MKKKARGRLAKLLLFVEFAHPGEIGVDAADRVVVVYDEEAVAVSLAEIVAVYPRLSSLIQFDEVADPGIRVLRDVSGLRD